MKPSDNQKPFPGLRPLTGSEINLFSGREAEASEILKKLLDNRFAAIIGTHGCGKTSVINCKVLPGLTGSAGQEENEWKVISITPGNDPLGNLAGEITAQSGKKENQDTLRISITDVFKSNPDSLSFIINDLIIRNREKVLLVVDQFEELFRYSQVTAGKSLANEATSFVNLLMNAVEQDRVPVYLIVAIDLAYISDCTVFYRFTQSIIINRSSVLIPDVNSDLLKAIIEKQAGESGIRLEPGFIEAVANEAYERNLTLPAVQLALMSIWESSIQAGDTGKTFSLSGLKKAGGLTGVVNNWCEKIYAGFDGKQKLVCEMIFRALTIKGPGNIRIRKPASLGLIKSVTGFRKEELSSVLDVLCSPGVSLLKCTGTSFGNECVADISYEPVIDLWERLKGWIDAEAESAGTYLKLVGKSQMFYEGRGGLLEPPEIEMFIKWRDLQNPTLQWAVRYHPAFEKAMNYLKSSEDDYRQKLEKAKAEKKKKSIFRRFLLFSLGLTAVIMMVFAAIFLINNRQKEKALSIAELEKEAAASAAQALLEKKLMSDSIASVASKNLEETLKLREDAEKKRLEALKQKESIRRKADSAFAVLSRAENDVRIAVEARNEAMRLKMIQTAKSLAAKSLKFNGQKDLQSLLAYQGYIFNKRFNGNSKDPEIYTGLYNVARQYGNPNIRVMSGHDTGIRSILFLPGEKELYTAGADGKILKWNLSEERQNIQVIYSGSDILTVLSVSPDAGWLACGTENSAIRMIPLKTGIGNQYVLEGHKGRINSLVFSFDGKYLYSAALDGKVLKWDLSARTYVDVGTGGLKIDRIDISSNGKFLAGLTTGGKALVWDAGSGEGLLRIEKPGKNISVIRFRPSENIIAAGYSDGSLEMWDINSKKLVTELKAHENELKAIEFSMFLSQMATAGADGTLKLWDLDDLKMFPVTFDDNNDVVITIAFSPGGQLFVAGTAGNSNNIIVRPSNADLLAENVCHTITRNLTPEEWYNFVGRDVDYEKTCAEKDFSIKVKVLKQ